MNKLFWYLVEKFAEQVSGEYDHETGETLIADKDWAWCKQAAKEELENNFEKYEDDLSEELPEDNFDSVEAWIQAKKDYYFNFLKKI